MHETVPALQGLEAHRPRIQAFISNQRLTFEAAIETFGAQIKAMGYSDLDMRKFLSTFYRMQVESDSFLNRPHLPPNVICPPCSRIWWRSAHPVK